jgi:hypothetical protein
MTVYDANVKIGCLVNPEPLRTPSGRVAAATGPVECATTRMVLPLPGEGADDTPMACPVCSQPFTIRRSSPARASRVVQRVFLAVAAAGLLLAAAGTVLSFPRSAEYAFAAVGFLGLVAAFGLLAFELVGQSWVREQVSPKWFAMPHGQRVGIVCGVAGLIALLLSIAYLRMLGGVRRACAAAGA